MTRLEYVMASERAKYDVVYASAPGYGHDCFGAEVLPFIDTLDFETVLDVGAGAGEFASLMSDRGKRVHTVDICPAAVELAAHDERLHCMEGHIPGLWFDGPFDLVTAFDVLEHVPVELVCDALMELWELSDKHVVASIAWTGSRVCGLDLHPCLKPREWWLQQLQSVFRHVQVIQEKPRGAGITVYAR